MLLVVTYSRAARRNLRNVCRAHADAVARRFGRAALFDATEFGAFQALRLREKHGEDVQLERTRPFVAEEVPDRVADAARAYERRDDASVPYASFAAGRDLPSPDDLRGGQL